MEFNDVIRKRRSIRSYGPRRPDPGLVAEIVDRARRAPTAGFSQGVDFLVLDSAGATADFWDLTEDPTDPETEEEKALRPPTLVIVWSDPGRYTARYAAPDKIEYGLDDPDRWPVRFWDVDAGMASMQLQLVAVDRGLDTWFFGISDGEAEVRARFDVPEDRQLCGVIALGYRSEDETPTGSATVLKRRSLDEQLHRNGW